MMILVTCVTERHQIMWVIMLPSFPLELGPLTARDDVMHFRSVCATDPARVVFDVREYLALFSRGSASALLAGGFVR